MTIPEKAAAFMKEIALDDSHGYDQGNRWGPDYDCSSLVIAAYKAAGVPLTCTYTGNMRSDFLNHGFVIPLNVNLATGAGLQVGDVLLNEQHHTAMYIGGGQIVQASGNEWGGTSGGKPGDQTGGEINIHAYYNFPWDYVLRYVKKDEPEPSPTPSGTYVVQSGDSLWSIAEKLLGSGAAYILIKTANNLKSDMIYPGQVLIIPGMDGKKTTTVTVTITTETYAYLKILAEGNNLTLGQAIDLAVEDYL